MGCSAFSPGIRLKRKTPSLRKAVAQVVSFGALLLQAAGLRASELEPRSYVHLPVGQNFVGLVYVHSEGDLSPSPQAPVKDARLSLDALALAYTHTFALLGRSAKVDLALPGVCYEGEGTFQGVPRRGERCEVADPSLKLSWNFIGSPAQTLDEFQMAENQLVAGASLQAGVPWGTYHQEHLLNAGTNRWMLKPGLGMSYRQNSLQYELIGTVSLFEDNREAFNQSILAQDPLYAVQAHLIYLMAQGRWLALNTNYFWGGQTWRNGVAEDTEQNNSRVGITFAMPLSPRHSLRLDVSQGVITRIGNDFTTLGMSWVYRF